MPIKLNKYILLFVLFFLLFYSESINVGEVTISQLWKMPLLFYLIYYLFQYRHKLSPAWTQGYYWLSLKHLVNSGGIKYLFSNIQTGISFLFLPLIFNFFQNRFNKENVEKTLLCISQYFILTNIPFLFFGFQTNKHGMKYGEVVAYTGIFQNQHAMSCIMGICIIVLLYFFQKGSFKNWLVRVYNVLLLILAAYAMYKGFARTGWVMCFIGVFILFMPQNMNVKQWAGTITTAIILCSGFMFMMITNKDFHDRVLDINVETGEQQRVGSGREVYIAHALELYTSGNVYELAFGKSITELKDYEYQKTGMRIYAHNGFVTLLVTDGAIGLLIKLITMTLLLAFILKRKDCPTYHASLAFWMMNLSFQLTQGGHVFHSDLLYALTFCMLQFESEEKCVEYSEA